MRNAVSGFKSAGIVPFDPDKFSDEDFAAAEEFQEPVVMDDAESSFTGTGSVGSPVPSTSTNCAESVPFKEVAPIPKYINKNKKDTNKKMHSEILTSTPIKNSLEEKKKQREGKNLQKEARQRKKEAKQKEAPTKSSSKAVKKVDLPRKLSFNMEDKPNNKKQKKASTLSETDESDLSLNEMCDDNEFDDIDMSFSDKNNEKCIFCDEFGRDNEQWFRCVKCGFWAHSECSGWDSPEDYECDMCLKKEARKKTFCK